MSGSVTLTGSYSIVKLRRYNKIEAYTVIKWKLYHLETNPNSGGIGLNSGQNVKQRLMGSGETLYE